MVAAKGTKMTGANMTKGERQELGQLIRKRERVMKTHAHQRTAELLAEFDASSAKIYHWDEDSVWAEAQASAMKAVEVAQAIIAARCAELGIPAEFAPGLQAQWYGRGHNAVASRRAELRRAAKSKIEAMEAAAVSRIEILSLEAQTEVVANGLESEAAKAFLGSMQSVEALMAPVDPVELQKLLEVEHARARKADTDRLN